MLGAGQAVTSTATILNFNVVMGNVTVHADTVQGQSVASCLVAPAGRTFINGLRVNGVPVAGNSTVNQVVYLPNGLGIMTVNEQSIGGLGIAVNAIHVHLASGRDFILSGTQASIAGCSGIAGAGGVVATAVPITPCVVCLSSLVSGSAAAVRINGAEIAPSSACNTASIRGIVNGQGVGYSLKAPTVPGAAALTRISCSPQAITSTAILLNVDLVVGTVTIHADTVQGQAIARCGTNPAIRVLLTGLHINNSSQSAPSSKEVNQTIFLPNNAGTLTVNEQIVGGSSVTVNALHIHMTTGQDIVIGSATAMIVSAKTVPAGGNCLTPHVSSSAAMQVARRD